MAVLIAKKEQLNRYTNNGIQIIQKTPSSVSGFARKRKNQELGNSDKKAHMLEGEEEEGQDRGGSSPKRRRTLVKKTGVYQEMEGFHERRTSVYQSTTNKKRTVEDEFSSGEWERGRTRTSVKNTRITQGIEDSRGIRTSGKRHCHSNKKIIPEDEYLMDAWEDYHEEDNLGTSPRATKTSIDRTARDTKGVHGKGSSQKHRGASNKKRIFYDDFSVDEGKDEDEEHKDNVGSSPTRELSIKKSRVTQEIEGFHGKRISERCRAALNKKRIVENDFYLCVWVDDEEEEEFFKIRTENRSIDSNGVKMKRGRSGEWLDDDEEEDFTITKTGNRSRNSNGLKMKRSSRDARERQKI